MRAKHLGSDQYQFGSCLELLVTYIMDGEPAANLTVVWNELQEAYRRLRTPPQARFRYLNFNNLTMFRRVGYPKLRGKASEIRRFGHVLRMVFESRHNAGLRVHREILLMLLLAADVVYRFSAFCFVV